MNFYINTKAIILRATGKDARRYLNARLSNDVKTLQPGSSCYAAALSPQGKTEAFFSVKCLANEEFLLTCDGGDKETVIKAFKRYMVADRVEISDLSSDHTLVIIFCDEEKSGFVKDEIHYRSIRSKSMSYDLIVANEKLSDLEYNLSKSAAVKVDENTVRILSLKAGIPSFPEELNNDIIFSASGLDFAVSFKKGCYVGQEVIEKIDAYGRVPYLLKAASVPGRVDHINEVKIDDLPLSKDKIFPHYYDKAEDKTYLFLELKNKDNILDSRISINNNEAHLIC